MAKAIQEVGRKYGRWTVLARGGVSTRREVKWLCRCDCGIEDEIRGCVLRSGASKSCGCGPEDSKTVFPGQRYGRLEILSRLENSRGGQLRWLCRCDCGNTTIVQAGHLRNGMIRSCRCLQREIVSTHNKTKTPEYKIWVGMISRCHSVKSWPYESYGGRGIFVCERWRGSFEDFITDMGTRPSPRHSIGRIDNDGPYSPENCRWETRKQQDHNKRNTVRVTYGGVTMSLMEWSRKLTVPYGCLRSRFKRGWLPPALFSIPQP